MDGLTGMNNVVKYIEEHLTEPVPLEVLAQIAGCSVYEFSRIFSFMVGVSVTEYIRRRRLSQAVFDIQNGNDKIIDIALTYGYESPTAFTRAFKELHGTPPLAVRKSGVPLKTYPPISFVLTIKGVEELNFRIEQRDSFRIIGPKGLMSIEDTQDELASLWNSKFEFEGSFNLEESPSVWPEGYDESMFKISVVKDTKNEMRFAWATEGTPVPRVTAAIDYKSVDGKVKAAMGFASDEINTGSELHFAEAKVYDMSKKFIDIESFEAVPAADWAVFTFNDKRNAANMAQAYARILAEWLGNSGYRRRDDMPHLERFAFDDSHLKGQQIWEIWMPVARV